MVFCTAEPLPPGFNLGAVESVDLVGELLGALAGISNLMIDFGGRLFLSTTAVLGKKKRQSVTWKLTQAYLNQLGYDIPPRSF